MIRSSKEILARLEVIKEDDVLSFKREVLFAYLDYEAVKPSLKDGVTEEEWNAARATDPLEEARDYMEFAWGKVEGHRGISAERSVGKMEEWLWLLGRDDLLEKVKETSYCQYGAPKLAVICEELGWPVPEDEGIQRMIRGEMCRPDCEDGCA